MRAGSPAKSGRPGADIPASRWSWTYSEPSDHQSSESLRRKELIVAAAFRSIPHFQPEVDALRPEVGRAKERSRSRRAGERRVRHARDRGGLERVDAAVNLVAGADDVADVLERVAGRRPQPTRQPDAGGQVHL